MRRSILSAEGAQWVKNKYGVDGLQGGKKRIPKKRKEKIEGNHRLQQREKIHGRTKKDRIRSEVSIRVLHAKRCNKTVVRRKNEENKNRDKAKKKKKQKKKKTHTYTKKRINKQTTKLHQKIAKKNKKYHTLRAYTHINNRKSHQTSTLRPTRLPSRFSGRERDEIYWRMTRTLVPKQERETSHLSIALTRG